VLKAHLLTILTASVAVVVAAGAYGNATAGPAAGPRYAQAKSSPGPPAVDACTLLTKEEAVSAVGEALDAAKATGPFPVPMGGIDTTVTACAYESPKSVHNIKLTVHRVPADKTARFKQFYQGVCARKECVSGLGDLAWWYSGQHEELQVLKNATLLIIKLSRSGDGKEALQTVAKKALGRLQ
jgi:hypothetical protein